MRAFLVVTAVFMLAAPAYAQEEAPADSRVLEMGDDDEDTPPPPEGEPAPRPRLEEAAPQTPPAEADDGSRVVGRKEPPKARGAPPPTPRKPRAVVRRDKDGKVIIPATPRPVDDPIRPRVTRLTGPRRAFITSLQVLAGLAAGGGAVVCGACAVLPVALISFINPVAGLLVGGGWWAVVSLFHVGIAGIAVWVPTLLHEADWLAAGAAFGGVLLVDAVSLALGGIGAAVILLRWPRGPTTATTLDRFLSGVPSLRGVDLALAFNIVVTAAAAALLAPIVGATTYTLASYARGSNEDEQWRAYVERQRPAKTTPGSDKPIKAKRRRVTPSEAQP